MNARILKKHISGNNHVSILRKKLNRNGMAEENIKDYLKKECLFLIQEIDNPDICSLTEDLLIAILREKELLLNS